MEGNNARPLVRKLEEQQVAGLHQVLQELRHQLRGGGGVGLVEVQGRVLNVVGGAAVVVDHRHPVAGVQQLPVLHQLDPLRPPT